VKGVGCTPDLTHILSNALSSNLKGKLVCKVRPLYGPGYVIRCVGNLTEEKFRVKYGRQPYGRKVVCKCVLFSPPASVYQMLNIEPSNFLMKI
jgi:hypothetical protein